jgi:hypothetical protein
MSGSPEVLAQSVCKLDVASDSGATDRTHRLSARPAVACRSLNTFSLSQHVAFRSSIHSRAASPVLLLTPRLLSPLRTDGPVTRDVVRVDTEPVVSGYSGRIDYTCWILHPPRTHRELQLLLPMLHHRPRSLTDNLSGTRDQGTRECHLLYADSSR